MIKSLHFTLNITYRVGKGVVKLHSFTCIMCLVSMYLFANILIKLFQFSSRVFFKIKLFNEKKVGYIFHKFDFIYRKYQYL